MKNHFCTKIEPIKRTNKIFTRQLEELETGHEMAV